jgi:DsbC/DsbD-like thiol-disulfide interchange protein
MVIVKMLWSRRMSVALGAVLLGHSALAQTYQGRELVKPSLLADTSAIVAGKPFTVGLLLRMAPGWHTYWKFSGDAGLPTEIKWTLPPGWKIGEIQWPIPLKTNDPGDIQTERATQYRSFCALSPFASTKLSRFKDRRNKLEPHRIRSSFESG